MLEGVWSQYMVNTHGWNPVEPTLGEPKSVLLSDDGSGILRQVNGLPHMSPISLCQLPQITEMVAFETVELDEENCWFTIVWFVTPKEAMEINEKALKAHLKPEETQFGDAEIEYEPFSSFMAVG